MDFERLLDAAWTAGGLLVTVHATQCASST
jgi:hypothetical protein